MKLHLYTDYKGICTAPGDRFIAYAKGKQPTYACFHIEVDHWQVVGEGKDVGSLVIVAKTREEELEGV
jgi:hypothetical protein